MDNYIISKSVFTSADGKETRTATVYTDRVEMTGDGIISPMVMTGKPLADLRDEMAVLVNYLITHKGWTKDESKSADNLPEIERSLRKTVPSGSEVHGTDDRYITDVAFPTMKDAADFIDNWRLEWCTTFRSRDGINMDAPFAQRVILQFPIHVWWKTVLEVESEMASL